MLILEIAGGIVLGQFVYQYFVDDLIQGYLKKKAFEKLSKEFDKSLQNQQGLSNLLNSIRQQKTDLH